jgi:hypothetical protein
MSESPEEPEEIPLSPEALALIGDFFDFNMRALLGEVQPPPPMIHFEGPNL